SAARFTPRTGVSMQHCWTKCLLSFVAASFFVATNVAQGGQGCGSPIEGSCFTTHLGFCNNAACCTTVCALDPFCCDFTWDSDCVNEAFVSCAPYVEAGPIIDPLTGHRRWLVTPQTWPNAQSFAGTLSGALLTISNGAENEWTRTYFTSPFLEGF